jgi:YrbI family 3-deoxy-D-manno-octulosonate 8-phosphate phosphatase
VVAFDFDGVFTDNRVRVMQDGSEAVVCNRADGLGLANIKAAGMQAVVLSSERNPVVSARCRKLELECHQGLEDKGAALLEVASSAGVDLGEVIFVGNDTNDVECLRLAGLGVAVADAHPEALDAADWVLSSRGGEGAVRELCDQLLERRSP